jgi:hypothetical protein
MRTPNGMPWRARTSLAFAHGVAQMERPVAGALRVILVRDRRTEQRHDAIAVYCQSGDRSQAAILRTGDLD